MKKLFTLLLICSMFQSIYGQECSNLFLSEILFGSQFSTSGERVAISDYAVEIFNPSDDPIDLSNYEIELIDQAEEVTQVFLDGLLESGATFVVANPGASEGVLEKADLLDEGLSFQGKVVLQLSSNESIIDRVGNVGEGIDLSDIDLDLLQKRFNGSFNIAYFL